MYAGGCLNAGGGCAFTIVIFLLVASQQAASGHNRDMDSIRRGVMAQNSRSRRNRQTWCSHSRLRLEE